jgi:hypothetical protein
MRLVGVGDARERARITDAVRNHVRLISWRAGAPSFVEKARSGAYIETNAPAKITKALEGIPDLRFVVLDTLRRFAQAPSVDEDAMAKAIRGAEQLAEFLPTRPTVALSHHVSKEGFRSGTADQYSGFGSGIIADNTRFGIVLRAPQGEEETTAMLDRFEVSEEVRTLVQRTEVTLLEATPIRGSLLAKRASPFLIVREGWRFMRGDRRVRSAAERLDAQVLAVVRRIASLEANNPKAKIGQNVIFEKEGGLKGKGTARRPLLERAMGMRLIEEHEGLGWRLTPGGVRFLSDAGASEAGNQFPGRESAARGRLRLAEGREKAAKRAK